MSLTAESTFPSIHATFRESGVVNALLNRRFGALYPTALVTYRKETDEVSRGHTLQCIWALQDRKTFL